MPQAGASLGIDVSERRGLDVVVLDGTGQPSLIRGRVDLAALPRLVADVGPDVIAVDAPSQWGLRGGLRACEQQLRRIGIQSYGTPSDPAKQEHRFNAWMKEGLRVYAAVRDLGYATYAGGAVRGTSIEVFPHATAVVLAGCLPPRGMTPRERRQWRASLLERAGVATSGLRTADAVDAALAALTGLLALQGDFAALGTADDGLIVVPGAVATTPYGPCPAAADEAQPRLPGMAPCRCQDPQCRALTRQEFAPGHDAKRKALLWERAREGRAALEELRRRGWELPADLRGALSSESAGPAPARARRSRP